MIVVFKCVFFSTNDADRDVLSYIYKLQPQFSIMVDM